MILFWLYAITKLVIFDINVWMINFIAPRFVRILNYKLPIILFGVVVALLATRSASLSLKNIPPSWGKVIQSVEKKGRTMERLIRAEFNLDSIGNAIEALQTAKAGRVGLILLMTKNLGK